VTKYNLCFSSIAARFLLFFPGSEFRAPHQLKTFLSFFLVRLNKFVFPIAILEGKNRDRDGITDTCRSR